MWYPFFIKMQVKHNCNHIQNCDWLVLFPTFAMNITQEGYYSLFPRQLSATNRAFLFDFCRLFLHRVNSHHYLYRHQNMDPRYPLSKSREPAREVRRVLCTSLETAIGQVSRFSLLTNDNSQKIHVIMPMIANKENSIWRSSLNVLFISWSSVHQIISFFNCFASYNISKDGFYCGSVEKWEQHEWCKWKESHLS